jgi:hypothetical protein
VPHQGLVWLSGFASRWLPSGYDESPGQLMYPARKYHCESMGVVAVQVVLSDQGEQKDTTCGN